MSIFGFIWFQPIQLTQQENEKKRDEKQRKDTLMKNDIFIVLVMWQHLELKFH